MFTTKSDENIPVPNAAKALSCKVNTPGLYSVPLLMARDFLKFSKIPNLADPMIPTPRSGVNDPEW